jgi:hypothetical protein
LRLGGMIGGDRMLHNGYAPIYAAFLQPLLGQRNLTIAEFGILKGTGLAIWCDAFPGCRLLGFDIDLAHFLDNKPKLKRKGAFKDHEPELHEFDQLVAGGGRFGRDPGGRHAGYCH